MLEALDTPYLQRALLAGVVLAVPLGLLGSWVVLRELAFFAHAVGVATFPGVVVGLVLPVLGPFAGALLAALGFSAAVSASEADHRLRGGAVTGLALAVALAAGAVLLTVLGAGAAPVDRLLFGSLLAVSTGDVLLCVIAAAVSLAVLLPMLPRLAATTFDGTWAGPAGARERATASAVLVLVSLVVVCALPAVGSLLVSALLVVPAATARLMVKRLGPMLVWATGLCAAETVAGLLLARSLDLPPGAAIAVVAGLAFGLLAGGQAAASRLTRVAPA
ncbi:MAG: metal ABC transporter permease [Thermoleophilaceae bacterium]